MRMKESNPRLPGYESGVHNLYTDPQRTLAESVAAVITGGSASAEIEPLGPRRAR